MTETVLSDQDHLSILRAREHVRAAIERGQHGGMCPMNLGWAALGEGLSRVLNLPIENGRDLAIRVITGLVQGMREGASTHAGEHSPDTNVVSITKKDPAP